MHIALKKTYCIVLISLFLEINDKDGHITNNPKKVFKKISKQYVNYLKMNIFYMFISFQEPLL